MTGLDCGRRRYRMSSGLKFQGVDFNSSMTNRGMAESIAVVIGASRQVMSDVNRDFPFILHVSAVRHSV